MWFLGRGSGRTGQILVHKGVGHSAGATRGAQADSDGGSFTTWGAKSFIALLISGGPRTEALPPELFPLLPIMLGPSEQQAG